MPGASVTISIAVQVDSDVLPGTILDNDVRAYQFGTEEYPPDNQNHTFVSVVHGPADESIVVVESSTGRPMIRMLSHMPFP